MPSIQYTLTAPVQAHGETLTQLTFREPTGKDVRVCGFPLRVGDDAGGFVEPAMCKMISALAGIPTSTVDALSMTDWIGAASVVAGFLGTPGLTSSTDTSISRSSSAAT